MNLLKKYWQEKPLTCIIFLALILRLIAVIFSKGYGMHDDHFLVIEPSQSWVDGKDYNNWLPWSTPNAQPSGHSFFYVGIHYLIFLFFKVIGFTDAQGKMYFIRLLHALLSLVTIYASYKITEKLSNKKTANQVGLMLAGLWFMPFLSVRNLVEVVCIPFMMYALWIIVDDQRKNTLVKIFLAGIIIGLGISVRFQTIIFAGGIGLALIFLNRWRDFIYYSAGVLISVMLIQGGIDKFMWGRPFAEMHEYIRYNLANEYSYYVGSWYNYILLILGILIPPVSFFLFFGFFRTWKKHLIIFLPVFLFLAFHSYFPNKQERFILPIVPFIVMLGMIGWNEYLEKSIFWKNRTSLLKSCWIFFTVINFLLLPIITVTYTKKSYVEAMCYLSKYKIKYLIIEDSNRSSVQMLPYYYASQWPHYFEFSSESKKKTLKKFIDKFENDSISKQAFIIFYNEDNLSKRVDSIKTILPNLKRDTVIQPGFIDKVMHWLNPINKNQIIYIYKSK